MPVPSVVNAAYGTTFSHGVGTGPTVYTAISLITSIDGPESECGTVETTHLTSGAWKTFRKTLLDGGEPTFDMQFDPKSDSHAILMTLFYSNTQASTGEQWQLAFTDAGTSKCSFNAIITNIGPSGIEPENNLMASVKLKISGAVVWT
jgi:Lambda phage tail tube protein, TTP